MTMQVIQRYELTGTQANIDFQSIPSTYTDLYLQVSLRSSQTDFPVTDVLVSFNNTSANQSQRNLRGYGGGVISQTRTDILLGNMPSSANTSNTFSNGGMYVPNYTASASKSVSIDAVSESNATGTYDWWVNIGANLWADNTAINRITLTPSGGHNFVAGSSATLYGITKGSDGQTTVS